MRDGIVPIVLPGTKNWGGEYRRKLTS